MTREVTTRQQKHGSHFGNVDEIISDAPILGHGTGSIHAEFTRTAGAESSATNPHNQILAVGIQLGLVGVILLIAMWVAHGQLFWAPGMIEGLGLVVVADNAIGSIFNSYLFDFTQGWIYVFGVGVAGGVALRNRDQTRRPNSTHLTPDAANEEKIDLFSEHQSKISSSLAKELR